MTIHASCHCGACTFEIDGELPERVTRCTCSFCSKRGALVAYYAPDAFRPTGSSESDGIYRWNTRLVAHHFCADCGIAMYSDSPAFERDGSWDGSTRRIGMNTRLFDDFDADALPVDVIDGRHLW